MSRMWQILHNGVTSPSSLHYADCRLSGRLPIIVETVHSKTGLINIKTVLVFV